MLSSLFVGLRFIHFAALMLLFGSALFSAWLAPRDLRWTLTQHFLPLQRVCLILTALSALLLYAVQGGMMAGGWPEVWQPAIWRAVAGTQAGSLLGWQIILALLTLFAGLLQPAQQRKLLLLTALQFLLAAGLGHAAMREGLPGVLQHINHALHLLCGAMWLGGLLPVLFCMQLTREGSHPAAIGAMMRFSRCGHVAVAGVILTGMVNAVLIQGLALPWQSAWGRMLLLKCALVALMVAIALVNRYVLVPRLSLVDNGARQRFITLTRAELIIGALVLAAVSLFATWEPF
ncbi:copper homeostasis membrane protein CopD [Kosakonia cowanii]|uniref:copper homeostasis membrane protein CopD n=1 Tax=Kosakonia cowanii TaxID=208223 RepID=UPI0028969C90|nr:copper homeostasis membrane protein CopD [Kosakonia cowanii]